MRSPISTFGAVKSYKFLQPLSENIKATGRSENNRFWNSYATHPVLDCVSAARPPGPATVPEGWRCEHIAVGTSSGICPLIWGSLASPAFQVCFWMICPPGLEWQCVLSWDVPGLRNRAHSVKSPASCLPGPCRALTECHIIHLLPGWTWVCHSTSDLKFSNSETGEV